MVTYRITKFDPVKRNEAGAYTDHSEWISISDIGKTEYRNPTYEEYEKVETAYVDAVKAILAVNNVASLRVRGLEQRTTYSDFLAYKSIAMLSSLDVSFCNDITSLRNGLTLPITQIDRTIRLILREIVWMRLVSKSVKVEFGYDYYMYVQCRMLPAATIGQIQAAGLFVE